MSSISKGPSKLRIPIRLQKKKKRKRESFLTSSILKKPSTAIAPASAATQKRNDDDIFDDILNSIEVPSDTVLTMRALAQRHATGILRLVSPGCQPIPFLLLPMLQSSLLSTSEDGQGDQKASAMASTGVSVDLERDCNKYQIRKLQLHGTQDKDQDVAVLEYDDFTRCVWDALPISTVPLEGDTFASSTEGDLSRLIELFLICCKEHTNTYIRDVDLTNSLEAAYMKINKLDKASGKSDLSSHLGDEELRMKSHSWIDKLISMQLLIPRLSSSIGTAKSYWFTLPSLGAASRELCQCRTQMLVKIRRSSQKEIKRMKLEASNTVMPGPFLVTDLLARGVVKLKETPSGQFVKIIKSE